MQLFDIALITAASERQADSFRKLIDRRIERGLYPREVAFEVVADPEAGRVGTGGSTLLALLQALKRRDVRNPESFLRCHRVLLVHAGGGNRRMPAYAPEGKLFAPLPVASSSPLPPVVLDLQLGFFFKYPWRRGEVLISSGDVVIDCDVSLIPEERGDVCGFAKASPPEQGARHGVFKLDHRRERVVDYLQKAPLEKLMRSALIEGTADCALDIGLVSLSPRAVTALLALGETPVDGRSVSEALRAGRFRFDLYLEMMTACLDELNEGAFWNRIRQRTLLPEPVARALYCALHPMGLHAVLTQRTTFVHVGSVGEFPRSCREIVLRELLPFYEHDAGDLRPHIVSGHVVHGSRDIEVSGQTPDPIVVEGSAACALPSTGGQNLLIGLENLRLNEPLPGGLCLDRRRLDGAVVTLVYGASDTFKNVARREELVFCGQPLPNWLAERNLSPTEIFDDEDEADLWAAKLFPLDAGDDFLPGYWRVCGAAWTETFRGARRLSLLDVQERDDVLKREERRMDVRSQLLRSLVLDQSSWQGISAQDFAGLFDPKRDTDELAQIVARTDDELLRLYRESCLRAIDPARAREFRLPQVDYVDLAVERPPLRVALKEDQIVWARAPVRLDLAGGWTDTPPYTLRYGGRVVNVAVNLNGQPPIQVFCRPTPERFVRIHSIDLGYTETITDVRWLLDYRDPMSPFSLPKAALCLMGFDRLAEQKLSLVDVLDEIGAGLEITLLCAVPKGSGLGTSSILGAAILAALQRYFGRPYVPDELFRQVLQVEQMLTTGGGWQDQIGGTVGGVKCIESRAGLRPHPLIYQLDPHLFQDPACLSCFTLFYTGLTRLAKNILSDVVEQVNGGSRAYLFTLRYMAQLATDAKDVIARRNRAALGRILEASWRANNLVHPSTSNSEVEEMFRATRPHYCGAKLLGAGGGGYALFLSADDAQAETLRDVLRRRFEDRRARLVDFSLSDCGLEISVS